MKPFAKTLIGNRELFFTLNTTQRHPGKHPNLESVEQILHIISVLPKHLWGKYF